MKLAKLVSDSKSKMKMQKKFGFDYLSFNTEFYFTYFFDFSVYVAIAFIKLKIQQSFSLSLIQPTYWNSKNNVNSLIILGRHIPPFYLHWDFRNFWHSPVWNIQFENKLDIFTSSNHRERRQRRKLTPTVMTAMYRFHETQIWSALFWNEG